MVLETNRLILRRYCKKDLQDLYEYLSDGEVVKYELYKPMNLAETEAELAERIASGEMIAVELKSNHKLIGNVYLGKREFETLEIGYVFNQGYWGCGYARESCMALIENVLPMEFTGFMQNVIPAILIPGDFWRAWVLRERLIFCRMCISGKTTRGTRFGRIPLFIPC